MHKFMFPVFVCVLSTSCFVRSDSSNVPNTTQRRIPEKDSLEQLNVRLLKEFAICQCLYAVPENATGRDLDISTAVYTNLLNYVGVDTLARLAKEEGQKIQPEKYSDYQNLKAGFFRCSQWANSKAIDALIRKYAAYSVAEEKWEYVSPLKK